MAAAVEVDRAPAYLKGASAAGSHRIRLSVP